MRLADFILNHTEPILSEWEAFARSIWPKGAKVDVSELRDHAGDILRATVADMNSSQSGFEQSEKSMGRGGAGADSDRLDNASAEHGLGRVASGFDLLSLVSEYRALRATVIRLWQQTKPKPDKSDLDDLTRFNESIDQSLTKALRSFNNRLERSRQMFLAILGHDLRNPLGAIGMSARMLAMDPLNEQARSHALQISASTQTMVKMIQDLLDFTLSGLGEGMPIDKAAVDLGALAADVIEEMRSAYPSRKVQLQAQGNLEGTWDEARLRQMLSNLVGNAIQHGSQEGAVELTINGEEAEIYIVVHNKGAIPANALSTLFDPLVRGASTRTRRKPGSIGLGLYIAREIAAAHGGTIDVESSPQAGTTFTVRLPRLGPEARKAK